MRNIIMEQREIMNKLISDIKDLKQFIVGNMETVITENNETRKSPDCFMDDINLNTRILRDVLEDVDFIRSIITGDK